MECWVNGPVDFAAFVRLVDAYCAVSGARIDALDVIIRQRPDVEAGAMYLVDPERVRLDPPA